MGAYSTAILLGLSIAVSYCIVAVNTIAITKRKYLPTFISSTLFMMVNFYIIKHVADAQTTREFIGYIIGGVVGDFLGIWVSKQFNI